jgi:hypothetical protein
MFRILSLAMIFISSGTYAQDTASIKNELMAKIAMLDSALSRHDATVVEKALANDAKITFSNGLSLNKSQTVKLVAMAHVASDWRYDKIQCWLDGNVAVLTYRVFGKQELHGAIGDYGEYVLAVWRKEGNNWLLVNNQTTSIPIKKSSGN